MVSLKELLSEGVKAKDMGLVESVKASVQGWTNMLSFGAIVAVNTLFVLGGLAVVIFGGSVAHTVGGALAFVIGLFGLFNNARYAL